MKRVTIDLLEPEDLARMKAGETIQLEEGRLLGFARVKRQPQSLAPMGDTIAHDVPPNETPDERKKRHKREYNIRWREKHPNYVPPSAMKYVCTHCPKRFATTNGRDVHRRIHFKHITPKRLSHVPQQ